jgi:hypothetical protein
VTSAFQLDTDTGTPTGSPVPVLHGAIDREQGVPA